MNSLRNLNSIHSVDLRVANYTAAAANITLANGANNDISPLRYRVLEVSGPTADFSITGFIAPNDNWTLEVFNTTSHAMTLSNQSASSAPGNQIETFDGADLVLPAGLGYARLQYSLSVGKWLVLASSLSVSGPEGGAGGDLSGTYPNPTVAKIKGTAVGTAGGALTTGKVLRVTGAAAADYGAVDLANTNAVTGALPSGNQAAQTMGGDVSGTTASSTVVKANGASVPAAGALTTGNVLQVSGASALSYGAVNLAGGAGFVTGALPSANQAAQVLAGDVSGTTATSIVGGTTGRTSAISVGIAQQDTRYNATLHTAGDSADHTIFTIPAANFASFANMTVMAWFDGRDTSIAARFFGCRLAAFQAESGTITQVGSTDTIGADKGGLVGGGAVVTIAVSGSNLVFTVNSAIFPTDWSVYIDIMVHGIA